MTTAPEASAQASEPVPSVRTKLAAAAAKAGTRRATTRRRTAAKKTTPAVSRNERAAKRGKYADRIAPAVIGGAALLSWRNPVAGRVIAMRADAWAASIDKVAAEDARVDAFLSRVTGVFGKGGAWGTFGQETALMVGGVMVATGRVPLTGPAGMVIAMFAGALVEQATMSVATGMAYDNGVKAGMDPDSYVPSPGDVAYFATQLMQERQDKAAARLVVEDQGDATENPAAPMPEDPTIYAREGW
jgi:hypothetical protein